MGDWDAEKPDLRLHTSTLFVLTLSQVQRLVIDGDAEKPKCLFRMLKLLVFTLLLVQSVWRQRGSSKSTCCSDDECLLPVILVLAIFRLLNALLPHSLEQCWRHGMFH